MSVKKSCFIIVGEQKIPLEAGMVLGNEDGVDFKVGDSNTHPFSLKFSYRNGSVTVFCAKLTADCKLGSHNLEMGKMYILEEGDEIILGELTFHLAFEDSEGSKEVDGGSDVAEEIETDSDSESAEELQEESAEILNLGDMEKVNENEDGEEEDDEETLMIKRDSARSHIKKLLDKNKDNENSSVTVKKKKKDDSKKKVSPLVLPGFWTRWVAWMSSIYCVVILDFYLLDLLEVKHLLEKLVEQWGNILLEMVYKEIIMAIQGKVPNASFIVEFYAQLKARILEGEFFYFDIIRIIIIYCGFDLISHILLGTSLPLFLCGVSSHDGFLVKRIRAFFRSIIGWFTLIPLVYDAPVLTRRRSFKEFITGTYLHYANKELRYFSSLLLLPLFLVGAPSFQFLLHFEELQKPVDFHEQKIDSSAQNNNAGQYASLALGLMEKVKVEEDVVLIPSFKIEKGKTMGRMIFYHLESNAEVSLSLEKQKIDLSSSLKNIMSKDPLVKYLSPDFYHSWNSLQKTSREWNRMIFSSITLSFHNVKKFLKERGIFCSPYINLKRSILSSLLLADIKQYVWISSEERDSIEVKATNASSYFIPLSGTNLSAYKLKTSGGVEGRLYRSIVKHLHSNHFFSDSFSKKSHFPKYSLDDAYGILDFFQRSSAAPDNQEFKKVTKFFKLLGAKAVMGNDAKLRQIILRELRGLDRELKNLPFFQKLNISLNRIQKAVEIKEYNFLHDSK